MARPRPTAWPARLARLRVFPDAEGRFDASLLDTGGAALVISQFTLYGDTSRGNRPSFSEAAAPELAEPLYERVCERLLAEGVTAVERGRFGAHMQVELVNDGPVTIVVESSGAASPGPGGACYRAGVRSWPQSEV